MNRLTVVGLTHLHSHISITVSNPKCLGL